MSHRLISLTSKQVVNVTDSNIVTATFDDIRLDSAAMPDPSGGTTPTATPITISVGPMALCDRA